MIDHEDDDEYEFDDDEFDGDDAVDPDVDEGYCKCCLLDEDEDDRCAHCRYMCDDWA